MINPMIETIWKNSPEYTLGYQHGYERARYEMALKLKEMQALYGESTPSAEAK